MQTARRRLQVARYSIGATALAAFAAFGFAVRDAHPATKATTPSTAATSSATDSSTTLGGSATISPAPQSFAPATQSAGS
jgi:hypothetical protein